MPTPLPSHHTRINLGDLKSQIAKKLGPERSQRYFSYVNQLLAQKLSKPDFNKYCLLVLGRENIHLHNHLISSILKNAFLMKHPSPLGLGNDASKPIEAVGTKSSEDERTDDDLAASMLKNTIWSNGNILPPSPRKVRSCIRDRRIKDHPSSLGQNGRLHATSHQIIRENDVINPCDSKRSMQHHQGVPLDHPAKQPRRENMGLHDQSHVEHKGLIEFVKEDAEDLERANDLSSKRGPLQAPLGIPFCPASLGGARRSLSFVSTSCGDSLSCDCGELCHTEALKRRMEKIAAGHGLEGVTLDCSNLLNNGLDVYLKCLIRSCVELLGTRSGHDQTKYGVFKQQTQEKLINGVWPGNHMHVQNSDKTSDRMQRLQTENLISLQDFRVAMELNPQKLGEDWPLLLEKICLCSYKE
ncbi:hypothetical protein OPV22_034695 [Ensete ventricosum]|uniref:Transcriptional coactivator Hfi1/Transcriptional adapter 1 n=1 Tax=Ensete ventricosum TaxID=4639 RepID=A0A426XRF1_ENSVE|nr:hypothetical protein OPV22_034695 [Ensete ventricosum]RRT42044.1 hypothetical protein B296_00052455 [Ensete ventricosum]